MIYIIGLALAFIFGFLMGRERERWTIDDAEPLDIKLTDADLGPEYETQTQKQPQDLKLKSVDEVIFYIYGGPDN